MFIFTAKLDRRKAVLCIALLALLLAAVILLVSLRGSSGSPQATPAPQLTVANEAEAAAYLAGLGWEVDEKPLEVRELVIPRSFSGAYADYAALQERQGLPLQEYGGMKATRYTFAVRNYPNSGQQQIVADLVVCGQTVIAGDIQSTALDGFMVGLKGEA